MAKEKAALFVDNSNIFLGLYGFSKYLKKRKEIKDNQYLRLKWDSLLKYLETQNGGIDIYARHFFASLPPAADVSSLKQRPTEEEWERLIKQSAQSGFYKIIQNPPYNFTLHGIPLRFAEIYCRSKMRQAFFKCKAAQNETIKCGISVDPEKCWDCHYQFLFKYEKGVDVALAVELIIFGAIKSTNLDRVILVAGDGDYKEAARYIRQESGRDLQIVSWRRSLSKELSKLSNQPIIYLEDNWKDLCEIRSRPPLEETPAACEYDSLIDDLDEK